MRLKLVYVFTALVYLASTSFAHADSSFKWSSTQRNVNGLVLVDGSPGANGGPGENGGDGGPGGPGENGGRGGDGGNGVNGGPGGNGGNGGPGGDGANGGDGGMVGMEMVPVTVEMEEMVAMAGTDETRYVAQM